MARADPGTFIRRECKRFDLYYLKIILSKINSILLADWCPDLLFLNFLDLPLQMFYAIIHCKNFQFQNV